MPFEAKPEDQGTTRTYALVGQLDSRSAPDFEKELLKAVAAGQHSILLDCLKLDYISSAGLRVLVMAGKRLAASGGRLALCTLAPGVKEVLDVAGFTHLFPIRASRDEALEWLVVSTRAAGITHLAGSLIAKSEPGKPELKPFAASPNADRSSYAAEILGAKKDEGRSGKK
jgi:stage II sporulation protein AA (anti-sigma F factor antagonist)